MRADTLSPAHQGLIPRDCTSDIPLSYSQTRLWFLSRLGASGPNYNELVALRLTGDVDRAALSAAVGDIVARHEILRTTFPERDGSPRQHVLPSVATSVVEKIASLEALADDLASIRERRFDLTIEPPLRVFLLCISAERHLLVLLVHHIATDAWSMGNVLRPNLLAAYEARRRGHAPALTALPIQYADYAIWQREHLGRADDPSSEMSRQLNFWRATLADAPRHLPLFNDRPRLPDTVARGGVCPINIPPDVHADLVRLARRARVTHYMVVHAAVAALLTRQGAGHDVSIGIPVSNRTAPILNDMVGFFVNTVVVRTAASGRPTFRHFLDHVKRQVLNACAHRDVPFEKVVEALNPPRSISRNPLFDIMLSFRTVRSADAAPKGRGGAAFWHRRPLRNARFDLDFEFIERLTQGEPRGILGTLRYSSALFDAETIQDIANRFLVLLRAVLHDPDRCLDDTSIVNVEESALVHGWARGQHIGASGPDSLYSRLIDAGRRWPTRTAVICGDAQWSAATLFDAAGAVARGLHRRRIGFDDVIGIVLPRSPAFLAAAIGVLQSAAAFVVLDPMQSSQTLAALVTSSRARWFIVDDSSARMLPSTAPVLAFERLLSEDDGGHQPGRGAVRPHALSAAVIAHTAGTTGVIRAVVSTHQGLATAVAALSDAAPLSPVDDRLLVLGAASADHMLVDCFWALTSGVPIILPTDDEVEYPVLLSKLIVEQAVTVVTTTPRVLHAVGAHLPSTMRPLRAIVGREACPEDVARQWCRSGRSLMQRYGATEAGTWSSMGAIDSTARNGGRCLDYAALYVLDERLQPTPVGVAGEIYAGGDGVARGYLGAAGLTAARFVADPRGPRGARMARLGDLGRWKRDGSLQILGRVADRANEYDRAEERLTIEATLRRAPHVLDAVVVSRDDGRDGMAAYVVLSGALASDQLTRDIVAAASLPPSCRVLAIDRIPTGPTGIVDLAALPPIPPAPSRCAPRTTTERALAEIFAELLDIDDVALEDDFFRLGGSSLLVTQLVNRVRTRLDVEIGIATVFDAPTVGALAARCAPAAVV